MENTDRKIRIKNPYIKQGLMYFVVGVMLIATYYLFTHFPSVQYGFRKINKILFPFYLGAVIAYLLCPIYNWAVRRSYKILKDKTGKPLESLRYSRVIATIISILVVILVIVGFIVILIPRLYFSVATLAPKLPEYFNEAVDWVEDNLQNNPEIAKFLSANMDNVQEKLIALLQKKILPASESFVTDISSRVISTISTVLNSVVALIICTYILNAKEMFAAQAKKLCLALCSRERAEKLFEFYHIVDGSFSGFISGKIIDSIIIGLLCFILMSIFGIPQTILISAIIGATNIIPFFGPLIGAIPCALLLLIIDPIECLKFVIMILVLQQFDGNILGPKILGKSMSLRSFWVMFAIIVGGGLFGVPGMILGVPVFAVIYTYVARAINKKLKQKDCPTDTAIYEDFNKYGIELEEILGKERVENAK